VNKAEEIIDIFVMFEVLVPQALDFASLAQDFCLYDPVEDFVVLEITVQYMENIVS
jgi:hypothetical protein